MRVWLLLGAFLISTFSVGASFAAPLGLTTATPALYDLNPSVDEKIIESPQRGYFDFLDAEPGTIAGNPSSGDWVFDVSMFFDWHTFSTNPFLSAYIEITGYDRLTGEGQYYEGRNSAWGFAGNVLEFHFTDLRQYAYVSGPELFGSSILVTVELNFALGSDPFQAIYDNRHTFNFGEVNVHSIVESPTSASVPLPAGLPMLLGGLGVLAAIRRRSKI